jgi:DNA polymerase-1
MEEVGARRSAVGDTLGTILKMAEKLNLPSNWDPGTERILILDGTNLVHRSFHGMRGSGLSHKGEPVWALHGLATTIARFIVDVRPTRIVTAFDLPGGAPQRRNVVPEYKGNRSVPEIELLKQLNASLDMCSKAGLGATTAQGWEADDVIASAARVARDKGWNGVVVSSDRDCYQLLSESCIVAKPDGKRWDIARLWEEIGVSPDGYRNLAALRGEPSDNLVGVPGFGEKTAVKLISVYPNPDSMLLDPEGVRSVIGEAATGKLFANFEIYRRNLEVGALRRDLPMDDVISDRPHPDRVQEALLSFGLPSAAAKLSAALRSLR